MALKLILQILCVLLLGTQWVAFAFQPQNNEDYVGSFLSHGKIGTGTPQITGKVVPATAPARNRLSHLNKSLTVKKASAGPVARAIDNGTLAQPKVRARAMLCLEKSSNRVVLAENESAPLPIASITKLLTAMVVIDTMDLDATVETPADIRKVEKHVVGIRPGDLFNTKDLLYGMLIESGNDCAEALARAYPKGGRTAFIEAMNRKAEKLGLSHVKIYTPSGLDDKFVVGRKDGRELIGKRPNIATAEDVAQLASQAFKYPLVAQISSTKTYVIKSLNPKPHEYHLVSNDKLLRTDLPVAGAKTGYTDLAGKCIVALFKHDDREHLVVVLNTPHHFKAAEKIYRWASKNF